MKFLIVFAFLPFSAWCSDTTSVVDSVKPHSIRKAVIWSSVLPGAGQIYNHTAMPKGKKKAFWKVPLIYAGLGTTGYFLFSNQARQKELRSEYEYRQDNGVPNNIQYQNYDDLGILTLYNQYLDWRDLSILAILGVYIIQIADAGVEAHFVNFDVSEDLSIQIDPSLLSGYTPALTVSLNFR